jgi:hypothetical protein
LICTSGGTCSSPMKVGEPCRNYLDCAPDQSLGCARADGGFACTPATYRATSLACDLPAAAVCSGSGSCLRDGGGLALVGSCGPAADDGQPCSPNLQCVPPSRCLASICTPPIPASSCP